MRLRGALLAAWWLGAATAAGAGAPPFSPRDVPIRWVELHASRHPECQGGGGPFRAPLGTRDPGAWRTSEWLHWMIERMNVVFSGSDIRFWLQSHDVLCTDALAEKVDGHTQTTPIGWPLVQGDVEMLFPHSKLYDLGLEALSRERWLEKGYILYGDPHVLTIFTHNDYVSGTGGDRISPDILPQHGYAPWWTPAVVFVFLSGYTEAPGWLFDPELTVAHEVGHDLGNCHTLDFTVYCVCQLPGFNVDCPLPEPGGAAFPDGLPYRLADHWDLIYVDTPGGPEAFAGHAQAQAWIGLHGTDDVFPIDLLSNVSLDPVDGRATVILPTEPGQPYDSTSLVPSVFLGQVSLMQGLSFGFPYEGYAWQRNIMSYRYAPGSDPYDLLTARFSTSQIEVMRRQLQGSVAFPLDVHGVRPPGTDARFAGRYHLLGDGQTGSFVWYSNGEGPGSVDTANALPDRIAFRSTPAASLERGSYGVADFDQDGADDLAALVDGGTAVRLLFSRFSSTDGVHRVHRFEEGLIPLPGSAGAFEAIAAGDFDADGRADLFLASPDRDALLVYLAAGRDCPDGPVCVEEEVPAAVRAGGPIATGNFDGAFGDDVLLVSHAGGVTRASTLWSTAGRSLTAPARAKRVAKGEAVAYAGDFDGGRSDDVVWLDAARRRQRIWHGSERKARPQCAGSGASSCFTKAFKAKDVVALPVPLGPALAGLVVGDFDGNGLDDLLVRSSDAPPVLFAVPGAGGPSFVPMNVALHDSHLYQMVAGEFDDAVDASGVPLGDDLLVISPP